MIAQVFDGLIVLGDDGSMLSADAAAEVTFGRAAAEFQGWPLSAVVPWSADFTEHAGGTAGRRGWWRTYGLLPDDSLFPITLSILREEDGRRVALVRDLRGAELDAPPGEVFGHWQAQLDTGRVLWSPGMYELHGCDPQTFDPSVDAVLELIEPSDRQVLLDLVTAVQHGRLGHAQEYRLLASTYGTRVLEMRAAAARSGPDGPVVSVHGEVRDITKQRLGADRLALHEAVASTLADFADDTLDLRGLLQRLLLALGWHVAALWVPDGERLTCRGFIAETGVEIEQFEQVTRDLRPRVGDETLGGQAWITERPVAVTDLAASRFFRARIAKESGIGGALALPAFHRDELLAVFEFFTPAPREIGSELLETLTGVGLQLGAFLKTHRGLLREAPLTPREREILTLASHGAAIREIAVQLHVSPATVKTHFQNLYAKLGVNDRPAAVAFALREGIIR